MVEVVIKSFAQHTTLYFGQASGAVILVPSEAPKLHSKDFGRNKVAREKTRRQEPSIACLTPSQTADAVLFGPSVYDSATGDVQFTSTREKNKL